MAAPKRHDPNDPKSSPRDAIIAATMRVIEESGEASVRVTEVAREAGVTQGMVSYYFKDREGLISEANIERFRTTVGEDNTFIVEAARRMQSRDEFFALLQAVTRAIVSEDRAPNRRVRTSVIGSIANRPDVRATVATVLADLVSQTEEIVRVAAEKGLTHTTLHPRAIAEIIMSYTQGLVVADLDPQCPPREELARVIDTFLRAIVYGD